MQLWPMGILSSSSRDTYNRRPTGCRISNQEDTQDLKTFKGAFCVVCDFRGSFVEK